MNASRKVIQVNGIVLGAVLFIAALFFGSMQVAQGNSRSSSGGMEHLRLETGLPSSISNSSMGDLRRFEQQPALPVSAPAAFTGFGDLRRYENRIEALGKVNAAPAGMGDLHLFESRR